MLTSVEMEETVTRSDKKPRKSSKKSQSSLRKGARGVIVSSGDHARFVIIEPRQFGNDDKQYWCVNLAQSGHPTITGHCQHAIKDIWVRTPIYHHREPDEFGHEATGVIVAAEPQPGTCLALAFHRWTDDGIEPEGIKIPSVILGRIQRIVTP